MSLAEGTSGTIRYKQYATGAYTSTVQAVSATDPGTSGGFLLRRVSSSLKLEKATYQSAEIRSDRQISDFRHGVKRVTGSVQGEFSPKTWFDLLEAAFRTTKAAAFSLSNTDFTSITSDNSTSTFTVTGGNPVTSGLRVGDIIRFGGLNATGNNNTNFVITGFSTANNRVIAVTPAPITDAVADTTFTVTSNGSTGKSILVPLTGHVARKFAFELNNSDIDVSRLFTECRIAGFTAQLPATGMATMEVPVMGRDMETYTGASAPFFTAPTAPTTTGVFAAVNGLLRVGGTTVGVVTGLNIQMDLNPSSDAVVGQNFVPEVFLGRANVTGQVTAFFEDLTLINAFKNETEVSILCYLTTTTVQPAPAVTIYLPRLKFGDGNVSDAGEGGQQITMPFQALLYPGDAVGSDSTTIRICDTEAV